MLNTFYTISNYITYLHIYIILSFTGLISLFLGYQIFEFLSWDSIYSMHSFPTDGGGLTISFKSGGAPFADYGGGGGGSCLLGRRGRPFLFIVEGDRLVRGTSFFFIIFFLSYFNFFKLFLAGRGETPLHTNNWLLFLLNSVWFSILFKTLHWGNPLLTNYKCSFTITFNNPYYSYVYIQIKNSHSS